MRNQAKHPLYSTWAGIKSRCNNSKTKAYKNYGGRGIAVDPRWTVFQNFVDDMGPKPSPSYSIDRRDNDGNYTPENCRWATTLEQAGNTRATLRITHKGETKTAKEWAAALGLTYTVILYRYRKWPDLETVPTRKAKRGKLYPYNGKEQSLREWSVELSTTQAILRHRHLYTGTFDVPKKPQTLHEALGLSKSAVYFKKNINGATVRELVEQYCPHLSPVQKNIMVRDFS